MIRFGTYNKQRGQALPLAVLLLGVGLLAVYMAFNVGQVASTKTRVMHASDNAAYSAANYQARVMNYMAYTNRAMITNHVTAAQAVTAAGYLDYQSTTLSNICKIACYVPYVGTAVKAADKILEITQAAVTYASEALMVEVNAQNAILAVSQQAIWATAMAKLPEIVNDVARANHPQAKVMDTLLADTVTDYFAWTEHYSTQSERWRFGRTVQNARDAWTANRSRDTLEDIQHLIPGLGYVIKDFRVSRRGGTELSNLERWESTDTLSVNYAELHDWDWDDGERMRIGWGSTTSGKGKKERGKNAYGRSKRDNPKVTKKAWRSQNTFKTPYGGIGSFIDLNDKKRKQTLQVHVEVYVEQKAVNTANQTGNPVVAGQTLRTTDQFVGNRIAASAMAETRFERPTPRKDGSTELASTFNPYWHARLVSPGSGALAAADTLSGRLTTTLTPYQ